MNLYLEFDRVIRALRAAKVPFAIAGGLAVGLHGFVRATKDIDLLVHPRHLGRLSAVLADAGYRQNPDLARFRKAGLALARYYRRSAGDEDLMLVDVLIAESPAMAALLRRARRIGYAKVTLRVVTLPDLYRMKRLRGSKLDAADIAELKKRHAPKRKTSDPR